MRADRIVDLDLWGPESSIGAQQKTAVLPGGPARIMVRMDGTTGWLRAATCASERGGALVAQLAVASSDAGTRSCEGARFVYGLMAEDGLLIRWTHGPKIPHGNGQVPPLHAAADMHDGLKVRPLWKRGPVPTS
ncbi:hypothetical protein [Streptomyces noursei]|uniref:hypothetical protein n=1 Tax=Streptomyces noursei TaxID=1971 RepID=UPI001675BECF|nr:hypothetical protein [Streptomyces noursei]MCZ1021226.1 hypothetical protein [Streptomyces noursei]